MSIFTSLWLRMSTLDSNKDSSADRFHSTYLIKEAFGDSHHIWKDCAWGQWSCSKTFLFIFFPSFSSFPSCFCHTSLIHCEQGMDQTSWFTQGFLSPPVAVYCSVSGLYAAWAFLSHCQGTDFTLPQLDVWSSERHWSLWSDEIFSTLFSCDCKNIYKYLIHRQLRRNLFF